MDECLNKSICVMCSNRNERGSWRSETWDSFDDWKWEHDGIVRCPLFPDADRGGELTWTFGRVNTSPPDRCPYSVEHLVSQQ